MTLSCSVNDVWHGNNGVPLEEYKKNITALVDKVEADGIKIVILTSTMIGEDQPNANNQKLIAYNDFLRQLAKDRNYLLVDLNADMLKLVEDKQPGEPLRVTVDGVHMAYPGNVMMATGILRVLGVSPSDIQKAETAWADLPESSWINLPSGSRIKTSFNEQKELQRIAKEKNISIQQYV